MQLAATWHMAVCIKSLATDISGLRGTPSPPRSVSSIGDPTPLGLGDMDTNSLHSKTESRCGDTTSPNHTAIDPQITLPTACDAGTILMLSAVSAQYLALIDYSTSSSTETEVANAYFCGV